MSSLCSPRIEGRSCPRRRSSWNWWDNYFNHRILCFGYLIFLALNILIITTYLPICMRLHVRHSVMTASPASPPSTSSADSAPKIKFAKVFSKVLKLHWKHHYCTSSRCRLCSNLIYNHLKCFITALLKHTKPHKLYLPSTYPGLWKNSERKDWLVLNLSRACLPHLGLSCCQSMLVNCHICSSSVHYHEF